MRPVTELLRFDEYMDAALYGPYGFYTHGGRPSLRDGDFVTSPELGTLFGQCIAGYLDRTWDELGRPDPFVVVEGGAGRGTLCSQVLQHAAECRPSLHYVMVERVDRPRADALAAVAALGDESRTGPAPTVLAASELPEGPVAGAVLANELLDNLPFRLLERSTTGWREVYVERDGPATDASRTSASEGSSEADEPQATSGPVVEVLLDAPADAAAMADALVPHAEPGARVPLQLKAAVWVRRALRLLERGRLLVFDYGAATTAELAARPANEWLRTYRSHRRGHDFLVAPGSADITCEVAFDQLPPGAMLTPQADWLAGAGIDDITETARNLWRRSRAKPTTEALAARTLLDEAAALTDPNGMGAFWAAEWRAG